MRAHIINPTTHILKLNRGESWLSAMTAYLGGQGIENAHFTGLGAVDVISCGYYDFDTREYVFKQYEGMHEVLNLTGNVFLKEGEPFIHAHATFSDEENQAFGGHVEDMRVGVTLEVTLHPLTSSLKREYDDETGLWLIAPQ